jgi:hypothetical protein
MSQRFRPVEGFSPFVGESGKGLVFSQIDGLYDKVTYQREKKRGQFGYGDIWTWVAIDADTKLLPSFLVGNRDAQTAKVFMDDLAGRLAGRVQLTTDGHHVYLEVVENAFGWNVDYAMLIKLYESTQEETRYSPAEWPREEAHFRQPRYERCVHKLRGAPKYYNENVYAQVHKTDQRI